MITLTLASAMTEKNMVLCHSQLTRRTAMSVSQVSRKCFMCFKHNLKFKYFLLLLLCLFRTPNKYLEFTFTVEFSTDCLNQAETFLQLCQKMAFINKFMGNICRLSLIFCSFFHFHSARHLKLWQIFIAFACPYSYRDLGSVNTQPTCWLGPLLWNVIVLLFSRYI